MARRFALGWMSAVMVLWGGSDAAAFTIESGFEDPCHERLTLVAYLQSGVQAPDYLDAVARGDAWEEIADYLLRGAHYEPASRAEKFFLFSLLAGVRAPDSEGFSTSNIRILRAIHANPEGQYDHCLRAVDDDFLSGNEVALAGCRRVLEEQLRKAAEFLQRPHRKQVIEVRFSLDQYGAFDVRVWAVAYHVGRAVHAMQDSFSHTLRTPDLRGVVHMTNYAEAIADELWEERDGMPHSDATDTCKLVSVDPGAPANAERVFASEEASADLLRAADGVLAGLDVGPRNLEAVLDKWLRYVPGEQLGFEAGCVRANDYCESPWLAQARLLPASRYLGCGVAGASGAAGSGSPWVRLVWALGLVAWLARRRR